MLRYAGLVVITGMMGCTQPETAQLPSRAPTLISMPEENNDVCIREEMTAAVESQFTTPTPFNPCDGNRLIAKVLRRCFPRTFSQAPDDVACYGYVWGGNAAERLASKTYGEALNRRIEMRVAAEAARRAKADVVNKAELARQEPPLLDAWRDCLFSTARRLATASVEPADTIVRATIAACYSQRQAIIEVHQKYGDPWYDTEIMNRIEQGVTGRLTLEIITTRGMSPPKVPPPPPVAPPSIKGEESL